MKMVKDNTLKKLHKFLNWKTHKIDNPFIRGQYEIVKIRKYHPNHHPYHEVDVIFKGEIFGHDGPLFTPKWFNSDYQQSPQASKTRINRLIRHELHQVIGGELTKFLGPIRELRVKKVTWE